MKKILLVDADIELYQIAQQHELEVNWGDMITMSSDIESAKTVFKERINGLVEKTEADDYLLCITGSNNFRKTHHPTYKANRVSRKPMGYSELKQYAMDNFPFKLYDELEADDVMGILATLPVKNKMYFIHSIDKDMYTIPAHIWDQDKNKIIMNPLENANRFLYTQILTGDIVDGYKGLPKTGKVKAEKILEGCTTEEQMREAVFKAYVKFFKEEDLAREQMLAQAQQARILRHTDWDMKNKQVKLWNPWGEQDGSSN